MSKIELTAAVDAEKYLVNNRREVVAVLEAVALRRELVTAYFGEGEEFLLTRVLAVSDADGSVVLDWGGHESANARLLDSGNIEFATTHGGVRVQFDSSHAERIAFEGRPAFRIALPSSLLRLQRREFYRLTTPVANPLKCLIPVREALVETQIVDISIGGVGLLCYATDVDLVAGARYAGARIDIPDSGPVAVALEIRNAFEVTQKNGLKSMRSGCRLIGLSAAIEQAIQRYILRTERARRAIL